MCDWTLAWWDCSQIVELYFLLLAGLISPTNVLEKGDRFLKILIHFKLWLYFVGTPSKCYTVRPSDSYLQLRQSDSHSVKWISSTFHIVIFHGIGKLWAKVCWWCCFGILVARVCSVFRLAIAMRSQYSYTVRYLCSAVMIREFLCLSRHLANYRFQISYLAVDARFQEFFFCPVKFLKYYIVV